MKKYLLLPVLSCLLLSCSSVNLKTRKDKDLYLSTTNHTRLKGSFYNQPPDTLFRNKNLYSRFTKGRADTLCGKKNELVEISAIDEHHLVLRLKTGGATVDSLVIKGRYKKGYFKVKRQFLFKGVAGPLVWVFGESMNYIGLSKENNLVVLNSGGTGVLFILALPIFVAGGDRLDFEYRRLEDSR